VVVLGKRFSVDVMTREDVVDILVVVVVGVVIEELCIADNIVVIGPAI
jgi:hypothetical protein